MACDICGRTGTTLQLLHSYYQTETIKEVCSDCLSKVNQHLWELRRMSDKMNENFLKRFMDNWKHKFKIGGEAQLR